MRGRSSPQIRGSAKSVDPDEFCELLVSRRTLLRLPRASGGLRALFDPATGTTFIIHDETLNRYFSSRKPNMSEHEAGHDDQPCSPRDGCVGH